LCLHIKTYFLIALGSLLEICFNNLTLDVYSNTLR